VSDAEGAGAALARTFREERGAVLATLIRYVGDIQLAEDAVQEAFAGAVVSWQRDGVPDNPAAWISVAARRRAIDRIRKDQAMSAREERLAVLTRLETTQEDPAMTEDSALVDDRLRLVFTCCHPALDLPARVALTLRTLGGLTTGEIARAFLVAEPTMGKRIVRAKRKIAESHIPYRVPADEELPERVRGVLRVVYLIFNEGYAASEGDQLVREDLCAEAIRLTSLLCELMPDEPESLGLLALMLLHDARRDSRVDPRGRYVPLEQQDRDTWDEAMIARGLDALNRALRLGRPGEYQLHAAITALHVQMPDADEDAWGQIAELYGTLARLNPSPVVEVNRAAAVGFAAGPEAALAILVPLLTDPALERYQPLYAVQADLLRRVGDVDGAEAAYERAIALTTNDVERTELERRLRKLTMSG
jgi:RNA polymerase sigma-70 factor, ECF subfamily